MMIVLSGPDGAGKSTQSRMLVSRLRSFGQTPVYLWTRGGYTPNFRALKELLRRLTWGRVLPPPGHSEQREQILARSWLQKVWLLISILDLLWVYALQVRWWQWRGRPVICDRYYWDTWVDFHLNYPQTEFESWWLWRLLVALAPKPQAVFLLMVPLAEATRRGYVKGDPSPEKVETAARRMTEYESLAQSDGWTVLDGRAPIDELARIIQSQLGLL